MSICTGFSSLTSSQSGKIPRTTVGGNWYSLSQYCLRNVRAMYAKGILLVERSTIPKGNIRLIPVTQVIRIREPHPDPVQRLWNKLLQACLAKWFTLSFLTACV